MQLLSIRKTIQAPYDLAKVVDRRVRIRSKLCWITFLVVTLVFAGATNLMIDPVTGQRTPDRDRTSAERSEIEVSDDAQMAPLATFTGTGVGSIPDPPGDISTPCHVGTETPLNISFNVTGLTGAPVSVVVDMTATHDFLGDLTATMIAPTGASVTLFGRTNARNAGSFGDSSDLLGTYTFSDAATAPPSGGWWEEGTARLAQEAMTPGTYRSTASGPLASGPQPPTSINAAFSSLSTANGTWILRVRDGCPINAGSVTAAHLTITTSSVTVSGRVFTSGNGRGVTAAVVTLASAGIPTLSTTTRRSGTFSFANVLSGRTYTVTVTSKRHTYSPQSVQVLNDVTGLSFSTP